VGEDSKNSRTRGRDQTLEKLEGVNSVKVDRQIAPRAYLSELVSSNMAKEEIASKTISDYQHVIPPLRQGRAQGAIPRSTGQMQLTGGSRKGD
jgi:hypothetical protein